jgi:hypothetical protein
MRTPRQPLSGPVATTVTTKVFTVADITSKGIALPSRWAFHAGVGFGKTSILAYSRAPIFLMTRGETGLVTLIDSGQLPPTPHFPEATTWADLLAAVKFLRTEDHPYKTLILDTANGAERMMHEYVCQRDFEGDWGERGFMGYQRGYEVALADWRMFLNALDELRKEKGMTIFFLVHTRIRTFKNPGGADYDRYMPEMHEKTWGLTKGWLDNIIFGNFEVLVKQGTKIAEPGKKGKAAEVSQRIAYTNSDNPTFDAKNRLGLPDEIDMGADAAEGWKNLSEAVRSSRKPVGKVAAEPEKMEAVNA